MLEMAGLSLAKSCSGVRTSHEGSLQATVISTTVATQYFPSSPYKYISIVRFSCIATRLKGFLGSGLLL